MQRYIPKISVVLADVQPHQCHHYDTIKSFRIPETEFTTVTTYCNHQVNIDL